MLGVLAADYSKNPKNQQTYLNPFGLQSSRRYPKNLGSTSKKISIQYDICEYRNAIRRLENLVHTDQDLGKAIQSIRVYQHLWLFL